MKKFPIIGLATVFVSIVLIATEIASVFTSACVFVAGAVVFFGSHYVNYRRLHKKVGKVGEERTHHAQGFPHVCEDDPCVHCGAWIIPK